MAVSQFSLNNQANININNQAISGNGSFDVYTSSEVNNNNNLPSLRVILEYSDPVPNTFINITAVIESEQNGSWFPIAYQFNPFTDMGNGPKRIIILQPNISAADAGIDDDLYVGNAVIARTSRQQGKVGSKFRVRFVVYENNHGTAQAFQSIKVKVYGELFD